MTARENLQALELLRDFVRKAVSPDVYLKNLVVNRIETVNKRLWTLREHLKMTEAGFAEKLGLDVKRYRSYERAGMGIPAYVLKRAASRFGVSLDWLLCKIPLYPVRMGNSLVGDIPIPSFVEIQKISRVDNRLINDVTNRIIAAVDPIKIILFGSYANGQYRQDSDLDILVLMNTILPRHKRSIPIYRALMGLMIPKDIVVYTPQEVEAWRDVPQAFITTAIKNGRLLHEKKKN